MSIGANLAWTVYFAKTQYLKKIPKILGGSVNCEGNRFPLHTIFLRDHTHFPRLLTLRSPI